MNARMHQLITWALWRSLPSRVSAFALLLAALALFLWFGCHKGPYVPRTEPEAAAENTHTLVLLGPKLYDAIAVEGQQAAYTEDGRLRVSANIRNRTNKRLTVQVQTVFKDENGFSTGDETDWQTIVITDRSQTTYTATAINSKARRYTIRIRSVR